MPAGATYTVFYDGPALGGRTATMMTLSPAQRSDAGRDGWIERLANGVPFQAEGRNVRLRVVWPYFANFAVGSPEQAMRSETAWIAHVARTTMKHLPSVQGVVLLVDTTAFRLDASVECLEQTLATLTRAGIDTNAIPFVFQLNKRDAADAVSIDGVIAALRPLIPPRSAFVESVSPLSYGVRETFETVVAMVDGHLPATMSGAARPAPSTVEALFSPHEAELTSDGQFRERFETRTYRDAIHFEGTLGLVRGWPAYDGGVMEAADGLYSIDIAARHAEQRRGDEWKPLHRPMPIAARVRSKEATAVGFETRVARDRSHPMFVLVGPKSRVHSVHQRSFSMEEYTTAQNVGLLIDDGVLLFNVGTLNQANVRVGFDAAGRMAELLICGDHAATLLASPN